MNELISEWTIPFILLTMFIDPGKRGLCPEWHSGPPQDTPLTTGQEVHENKKTNPYTTTSWWHSHLSGTVEFLIKIPLTQLHSSHTLVMFKILQARLQQYVNRELPDVQASFRKGRGTRDQIPNIRWIMEKAWEFQKNIYFCFIDYAKAFDCVDHKKLWKILKEMGILDHLTCLLRNLYADQEATVRNGHGTTHWFQLGKGVHQGCILSPCLFNLYAEYIMRNNGLEKAQAGIRIGGRNINNLRYADDTTLMAESEEELQSLLMKVKVESEKVG